VSVSESVVCRVAITSPRITYAPRPDATPEAELAVLAAVYRFVLVDSQSTRGGSHDVTNDLTKKQITGPEKKGKVDADLYGN
jgi:hypothetical protein